MFALGEILTRERDKVYLFKTGQDTYGVYNQ
jgi:hypothetical protein